MERDQKMRAVLAQAMALVVQGRTMTFDELGIWLNVGGFSTSYGTPYLGGRGVARLVHSAYNFVHDELGLGDAGAAPIAEAFTDKNGNYAYD